MNSNAKFEGFTPEELAQEPEIPKEEPVEPHGHHFENGAIICDKSPESGQQEAKPAKKHKKKKTISESIAESLPQMQTIYYDKMALEHLKANTFLSPLPGTVSPFDPAYNINGEALQGHWDTVKQDDLVAEQKAQQAQLNAEIDAANAQWNDSQKFSDFLSADDIKKAAKQLKASTPYSTYIMGKDAVFKSSSGKSYPWFTYNYGFEEHYQKEIKYLKDKFDEAKEIIKQLSGEPGEFIYIHPFDLYELLNSFVIPPLLHVDDAFKDPGYIEINGKKYKQSTLMPIVSKNGVVDATKYNQPDLSKTESIIIKELMTMAEFEKKYKK